jgi:hypothetical protein
LSELHRRPEFAAPANITTPREIAPANPAIAATNTGTVPTNTVITSNDQPSIPPPLQTVASEQVVVFQDQFDGTPLAGK